VRRSETKPPAVTIQLDGKPAHLTFWDTAGGEDYDRLRPLSYPQTDVFILCFSLASKASLDNIQAKWLPEIRQYCPGVPYILVGTKLDLRPSHAAEQAQPPPHWRVPVSPEEGPTVAEAISAAGYVECSAFSRESVDSVVSAALMAVLKVEPLLAPERRPRTCTVL